MPMKDIWMRLAICCLLIPLGLLAQKPANGPIRIVDLTAEPTRNSMSTGPGLPGFSSSSAVFLLPLTLGIESIRPATNGDKVGLYLLVSVRNLSDKDFELPIGRDVQGITSAGQRQRKTFAFLARAICRSCDHKKIETAAVTASSSLLPDSRVVLRPFEQIYVNLFVDTGTYRLGPDEESLDLQLGCQETYLEDARYFIKSMSTKVWMDLSVPRAALIQGQK